MVTSGRFAVTCIQPGMTDKLANVTSKSRPATMEIPVIQRHPRACNRARPPPDNPAPTITSRTKVACPLMARPGGPVSTRTAASSNQKPHQKPGVSRRRMPVTTNPPSATPRAMAMRTALPSVRSAVKSGNTNATKATARTTQPKRWKPRPAPCQPSASIRHAALRRCHRLCRLFIVHPSTPNVSVQSDVWIRSPV